MSRRAQCETVANLLHGENLRMRDVSSGATHTTFQSGQNLLNESGWFLINHRNFQPEADVQTLLSQLYLNKALNERQVDTSIPGSRKRPLRLHSRQVSLKHRRRRRSAVRFVVQVHSVAQLYGLWPRWFQVAICVRVFLRILHSYTVVSVFSPMNKMRKTENQENIWTSSALCTRIVIPIREDPLL